MSSLTARYIELCVFAFDENEVKYLLLHRTKEVSIYPGIWQIITGNIEEGEPAWKAALRELQEETGIPADSFWVVPHVNSFYRADDDTINFISFFAAQVKAGSSPKLSPEHDRWEWVSFAEAEKRLVWPGQKEGLRVVHEYIAADEKPAGKLLRLR